MGKDLSLFYDAFDAYMKEDYQKAFDSLETMRFCAIQEKEHPLCIRHSDGTITTKELTEIEIEELDEYIRLVEVLMAKISIKFESHDPKGIYES